MAIMHSLAILGHLVRLIPVPSEPSSQEVSDEGYIEQK